MPLDSTAPQKGSPFGLRQVILVSSRLMGESDSRVLLLCSVVLGLAGSFVVPYLSLFGTRDVGMSLTLFGGFMTLTTGANVIVSTLVARHSDRIRSRRPILILGATAGAVGYLGYALIRNQWWLLVLGTLVLSIASLTFPQLFAHARERLNRADLPPREAPFYMNAFRMAFAAAWTFGPALAALTLRLAGFRGLFLAASAFYVALLAIVIGWVPSTAPASRASEPAPSQTVFRSVWAQPGVLSWFVAFVLIFAAQSISMSNMSLLVLQELHGSETQVGIIFGLAPVFELPLMLYSGLLATRLDSKRMIVAAFAIAVVYYGALTLVQAPWQVYPLQLLSAAIIAVTNGIAITFFQDMLPQQYGSATNLYVNALRLGSTSGYLLFGSVASQFGHRGAYVACTLLAMASLVATVGLARRRQVDADPRSAGAHAQAAVRR